MTLRVSFDELISMREAARELPRHLDALEQGEVAQLVITRRSEPRAVLITVARYEELLSRMRITSKPITALEHNHSSGTICGPSCPRQFEQVAT